jgi:colicin import membrane protein
MARPEVRRPGPWLGSVALHVVLVALLATAALRWRSDAPLPQLAIEGDVVRYEDLPARVRAGKPLREPAPKPAAQTAERPIERPVDPPPEPAPQAVPEPPPPEPVVDQARQQAEARQREQERIALERRQAEERAVRDKQAVEAQRRQQAAEDRKRAAAAEAEAKRKAAVQKEQKEQKEQEALAAKQKQAEQEKAAREARARAEREAELRRALASEEEGEAIARSGVVDEYRAMLIQTIERNWNRPPSARAGLECTLYVTQATGGTVIDVKIGECNGDQAVRESVANAVYRSSPLPAPRDPRAFERRLVMVFKPTE